MGVVLVALFLKCSHTFEHPFENSDKINIELSEESKKKLTEKIKHLFLSHLLMSYRSFLWWNSHLLA